MGILKNIAIGVLSISIITFIALFGRLPAFRKGPIGFLYRLIFNKIPAILLRVDNRLLGGRLITSLQRMSYYLMHENHPLVLIFFLALLIGSQVAFIRSAYSRLSTFHRVTISVLCITPYIFIYKTVTSTASYITPHNHWQRMQEYPYDHVLFKPGRFCRTCNLRKPARSKHCSMCHVCVAKHDHHCIWVMNCVGKANYAYFISMVSSLAVLLTYGAYLTYALSVKTLEDQKLRRSEEMGGSQNGKERISWSLYFELWAWAFTKDIQVGAVGMLAAFTAPLAWGFFLYHAFLVWRGTTTNESSKWADWNDDVADGLVFRSERDTKRATNRLFAPWIEPVVDWPISSSQLLIVRENGQPPDGPTEEDEATSTSPVEISSAPRTPWKRLRDISEIDNLYDLGFWDNIMDALQT